MKSDGSNVIPSHVNVTLSIDEAWKINKIGTNGNFLNALLIQTVNVTIEHEDKTAMFLVTCSAKTWVVMPV
jgi:hypothetical protein